MASRWAELALGVFGALAFGGLAYLTLVFEAASRGVRAAGEEDALGFFGVLSVIFALGAILALGAGVWGAFRPRKA